MHSLKLFATVASLQLEMGVWGDYDRSWASPLGSPWAIASIRR